jgi:hypothetical protein
MQKVVGSSPISRFGLTLQIAGFFRSGTPLRAHALVPQWSPTSKFRWCGPKGPLLERTRTNDLLRTAQTDQLGSWTRPYVRELVNSFFSARSLAVAIASLLLSC